MNAVPYVLQFWMDVDRHDEDCTKAACLPVSDVTPDYGLPLLHEIRERGVTMLVDVTVAVPDPAAVDLEVVKGELPHGEVSVQAVSGGLRVPGRETIIACAAITVSAAYPENS